MKPGLVLNSARFGVWVADRTANPTQVVLLYVATMHVLIVWNMGDTASSRNAVVSSCNQAESSLAAHATSAEYEGIRERAFIQIQERGPSIKASL